MTREGGKKPQNSLYQAARSFKRMVGTWQQPRGQRRLENLFG